MITFISGRSTQLTRSQMADHAQICLCTFMKYAKWAFAKTSCVFKLSTRLVWKLLKIFEINKSLKQDWNCIIWSLIKHNIQRWVNKPLKLETGRTGLATFTLQALVISLDFLLVFFLAVCNIFFLIWPVSDSYVNWSHLQRNNKTSKAAWCVWKIEKEHKDGRKHGGHICQCYFFICKLFCGEGRWKCEQMITDWGKWWDS